MHEYMKISLIIQRFVLIIGLSILGLTACDNQSSSNSGSSSEQLAPKDAPESSIPDSTVGDMPAALVLTSEINGLDIILNWQALETVDHYMVVMSGGNYPLTEIKVEDASTYSFSVSQDQYFNIVVKGFDADGNMMIASQTIAIDMEANAPLASDSAP